MADEFNDKLKLAIQSGHLDDVCSALNAGADAEGKFEDGMTPLQLAVVLGYSEIVELFLDKQIKIDTLNGETESTLHLAIRNGNVKIVKLLLEKGTNVNQGTLYDALVAACKCCNHPIVKLLLDKGACVNYGNYGNYRDSPLHIAISHADGVNGTYCSTVLLEHGANVDACNRERETPLSLAAKRGFVSLVKEILLRGPSEGYMNALKQAVSGQEQNYKDIVDCLIDYGTKKNVKLESFLLIPSIRNGRCSAVRRILEQDMVGCRTISYLYREFAVENKDFKMLELLQGYWFFESNCKPLPVIAAKEDWVEGCKLLLDHNFNVNHYNEQGETALHCAKSREMAEFLLDKGADLQAATKQGLLPLHTAVKNDYKEVVSTLLSRRVRSSEFGEKISVVNKCDILGKVPLHYAVSKDVAQILLDNGAKLDVGDYGYSPLHAAAQNGHEEVASTLLRGGAKVNVTANYGMTPLHYAARRGNLSVVNELIRYGAEIDQANEYGFTPLCDAIMANNLDILQALLNSGANAGLRMQNHGTPLHFAAKEGLTEMIECLLRHADDINIEDDFGKTALHIAAEHGKYDVVLLLLDAGAGANIKCKQGKTPLDYAKSFIVSSSCGNMTNQKMIRAIESNMK